MPYIGQQPGYSQIERYLYTATGSETSVSVADDGRVIAYDTGSVDVYLNGVKLIKGTDFAAPNGSQINFTSALTVDDVVEVLTVTILNLVNNEAVASGGTSNAVFWENDKIVTANYTITAGKNAMSAGPIEIQNGVTVTVPDGSTWTVV